MGRPHARGRDDELRRETSLAGPAQDASVERFTRMDADTLLYEFRSTIRRPGRGRGPQAVPMKRISEPISHAPRHEGNYAMLNILSGARAQDRELAAQQTGK